MVSLTDEVISFLMRRDPHPRTVRERAIEHLIDGFAVMLAGSRTGCARKIADYIEERGDTPIARAVGFGFRCSPTGAALINGTSGHADDYDDTQLSSSPDRVYGLLTHPTVPALAAALAVAEAEGSPGRDLVDAFIAGFEVECKLAEAIKPRHYREGFHTTATIGTFGALAAASVLMELGEVELRHGLGIAASLASGIRANFGTMTKPLHAGTAAYNGVLASDLAGRGFTADKQPLDGRWGFMAVLGGGSDPEKVIGKMGSPYSLMDPGASVKMYPCGSLAQPSMDALLDVVREEQLKPGDVGEIRLRAGPNILEPLRYEDPTDPLQAKFSLQFGLATILLKRRAGLREYTEEWVNDPTLRDTMRKVKTISDPEVAGMGMDKMRSILEVEMTDGRVIKRTVDKARGTSERPLGDNELEEKFRECAGFVLDEETTETLLETIRNVDKLPDIEEITRLLGPEIVLTTGVV